jgi:transposase InsO family protein
VNQRFETPHGAAAHRPELAAVPAPAGSEHARLRFLHRRDALAAPLLRPLLHRTPDPCSPSRLHDHPTGAWVTQQARNLGFTGLFGRIRFLVHDRDAKFTAAFDKVFRSEGITILHTPVHARRANAYAERFVRTVRGECLDWLLILGRRHLEHTLRIYTTHYNRERPHRALELQSPETFDRSAPAAQTIERRDLLGGLIHEYQPAAA